MSKLNTFLIVLALLGVAVVFHRQSGLEERIGLLEKGQGSGASMVTAELEVAEIMGRLERHHAKWWRAGHEGNAELAAFYLHEMEEAMEELATAGVVEDSGVDISAMMRTYGLPAIASLERSLQEDGVAAMHAGADVFVATCNSCHVATGHGFIRVKVPTDAAFPGQDMRPGVE